MRTIKFRIWNKFLEKMSEPKKLCIDAELNAFYIDKPPHHDFELMQFTGLYDKNGKEIYEGDIVNWGMHHNNSIEHFHRYAVVEINPDIQFRIIFYINSKNGTKKETDNFIFRFGQFAYQETNKHLEVIGNIYENPELLKN